MPRIIRSSGVNIEKARPIVAPLKPKKPEPAAPAAAAPEPVPEAQPVQESKSPDMTQIYASAETVVQEIIAKARSDADNILVDARQETIKVLQDAVREGWDQGVSDALAEMTAVKDAALREVEDAVAQLRDERAQIIREVERDVVGLVFDIVEKVLAVEMNRSDAWIEAMVKEALNQMEGDDSVVIKVAAPIRRKVAEIAENMLSAAGKPPSRISVAAEAGLTPGGCVIETPKGIIDTSVENKLDKLHSVLKEHA